jgi:hypothetical protein
MVRSTLALAAVLSVASISLAGDLVTPSIGVGASTNAACKLVNISSSTITAQLQLVDSAGSVLLDSGSITVVAGHETSQVLLTANDEVYCRFVKASKSKVRASLTAFGSSGDRTDQIVVAAE